MLQGPTVHSLIIDSAPGGATLIFSASERDCDSLDSTVSCQYLGRNVPLKITFRWGLSRSRSDGDHIISNILGSMSLTNVHSAHFIAPSFSPAFWRKTLVLLQDLRYIKLSAGNMPDLASVLSLAPYEDEDEEKQDATGDRDSDHILAPGLEELELHQITFSPGGNSNLPEPATTQRLLFDALSARNVPRGRVTMTQCRVGKFKMWDAGRTWDGDLI
ncbi:hypothetical protein OG21DRAFT_911490 [Imleria badia]|nr:hypothetical protein OG21DRAFT_911490 [Imleria badia]